MVDGHAKADRPTTAEQRVAEALRDRLGTHLKGAEQAMVAAKTQALAPLGLSIPQYAALFALALGPLSGAQLARVCSVTPQSVSSLVGNLEAKGLVSRTPSEVHAQVLIIELTALGRDLFDRADAAACSVEADMAAEFDAQEIERFRSYLDRLANRLRGRSQSPDS